MTKFNVPHVQTVLKITQSPVQTRFSRLEQSQSWNFMKCAVIKITANLGRTPPQIFDRMGIDNHFWPTSQRKVFKIGGRCTILSAAILTLGWFSAVLAQCGVEFQKKYFISMFLGTYLNYDSKTIFFLPCTQWAPEWRKAKNSQITSNQVKSYTVPVQPYGGRNFFFFTTWDVRTGRAFEITNKIRISQIHQLTGFESTNNPCS